MFDAPGKSLLFFSIMACVASFIAISDDALAVSYAVLLYTGIPVALGIGTFWAYFWAMIACEWCMGTIQKDEGPTKTVAILAVILVLGVAYLAFRYLWEYSWVLLGFDFVFVMIGGVTWFFVLMGILALLEHRRDRVDRRGSRRGINLS